MENIDTLYRHYDRLLSEVDTKYLRYLHKKINWKNRLIAITGARGTGKTTMLLQHIKQHFKDTQKALYVSLDNIWFAKNTLSELAERFYAFGGTHLFLDEVHRYPNWAIEIKNLYDSFPKLHIVFTGSSILRIYQSNADLSRRAMNYSLAGLSFREFLQFEKKLNIPPVPLQEILSNHQALARGITSKVKVLPEFRRYLKYGYYPFYKEDISGYPSRLQNVVNIIFDSDIPMVEQIEYNTVLKIKKMLMIIASLVPFTPNIASLCNDIETNRAHALKYLGCLEKACLIRSLLAPGKSMSAMSKPEKIYLDNSNLLYALANSAVEVGNIRETFFANQLSVEHKLTTAVQGDFVVDSCYIFEVGGASKTFEQIKGIKSSFIAADDIETGWGNKIPLWLFGMCY